MNAESVGSGTGFGSGFWLSSVCSPSSIDYSGLSRCEGRQFVWRANEVEGISLNAILEPISYHLRFCFLV